MSSIKKKMKLSIQVGISFLLLSIPIFSASPGIGLLIIHIAVFMIVIPISWLLLSSAIREGINASK